MYTQQEYNEFKSLIERTELKGFDNYNRNIARIELNTFVKKHGEEKCHEMFRELTKNDYGV